MLDSSTQKWENCSFAQIAQQLARATRSDATFWEDIDKVAMLRFYGDDSFGRNEPGFQGCCVVAGFMTDGRVWRKLAKEWRAVLDSAPKIDYFRMREYVTENLDEKGQFQQLTGEQADAKLEALMQVLQRYGNSLAWVESIITWDVFRHGTHELGKRLYKDPHYFGITGVITGCRETIRSAISRDLPVLFVFDEQDGMDGLIYDVWKFNKRILPREETTVMGSLCFTDDRTQPPLQCADLLAWHVRREYIQPPEDHGRSRPAYVRLCNTIQKRTRIIWNEEGMKERYADLAHRSRELQDKFHVD